MTGCVLCLAERVGWLCRTCNQWFRVCLDHFTAHRVRCTKESRP